MPRRFRPTRAAIALVLAFALVLALAGVAPAASPAWTTYRHDAARSGIDPDSTSPVTPSQAWQTPGLDGQVYGQPLVYGSDVYVATENDTIYKLDGATGAVVWARHLATPEPASAAPCGDIDPTIGITGTPVIDPATNRIYAVGAVASSGIQHELFAVDLASGNPVAGFPIPADPPYPSGGTPVNQLQRAGLALDAGRVLIGYGGNDGDCNTYWGWVVSAPTDGSRALSSFQVDPGYGEGAIWGAGNAPAIDAAGNAFVATGNGTSSVAANPAYGDSVVKVSAAAALLDWWAPTNWQSLDASDADLGSSMPTLLPGGYLFESGKDGDGYLLNGAGLGHVRAAVRHVSGFCPGGSFGGSVYDPASGSIYVACSGGLQALSLGSGSPPTLTSTAGFGAPSDASGPPMIAAGLVWVASYGSGTLYAINPATGAAADQFGIPESATVPGSDVNHFASPSAGGGRLFVGSGNQVTAFTIAATSTATPPPIAPPPPHRPPPSIARVSVAPRRFTAARGTTLRVTLSEAATLTVAVTQLRRGHRVGRSCSLAARRGRQCFTRVTTLRLLFRARGGRRAFTLHLRTLKAGHYTALVSATDSLRRRSRTLTVTFTVVRPRH